jgi:predicted enzyme related to lactoylglutathione lyase
LGAVHPPKAAGRSRVDDIDETLERLRNRGAQIVGEVVQYKDTYRGQLWSVASD